jgi:hypothetical protein
MQQHMREVTSTISALAILSVCSISSRCCSIKQLKCHMQQHMHEAASTVSALAVCLQHKQLLLQR